MLYTFILPCILLLAAGAFFLGKQRASAVAEISGGIREMHSLPVHYGVFTAMNCLIPALVIFAAYRFSENWLIGSMITDALPEEFRQLTTNELSLVLNEIKNVAFGGFGTESASPAIKTAAESYRNSLASARQLVSIVMLACAAVLAALALRSIDKDLRARNLVEKFALIFLVACAAVAIFTTLGIVFSVVFEAIIFFRSVPIGDFLFGLDWSPQIAMRADQAGSSGAFGAVPVFVGTFLIASIAMLVAIPVGLCSAIYLSEYASPRLRTWAKPTLEILAGIPTVVYGFFAALTVAPLIRNAGEAIGLTVASESALAAGLVMGVMIIPFVSSLSDDVIHAVPQAMRDGSFGLGATRFETIRHVIIPAALPGIVGSILLAVSRAVGETMIVVMAAGLSANLSFNPLTAVTTVTVQIVTLLVGDQEFDSPKTLAAFALGLLLFVFTLVLNVIALRVVRRYREQYE